MIGNKRIRVQTVILPGGERTLEEIYNNDKNTVIDETKVPCPKEGIILVCVKWEESE